MEDSSIDINACGSESRLLSMDSLMSSTGQHYQPDLYANLSLSELSLSDDAGIMQRPFSLLARQKPEPEPVTPVRRDGFQSTVSPDQGEHDDAANDVLDENALQQAHEQAAKQKEEKLQSDIFILKKLNSSFELFNDALSEAGSANQRIVAQLQQTNALLDQYVDILSKSEEISRLIFDMSWQGADADEATLEQERLEEQRIRLEKEAEARRVQQELFRIEQEKELRAQAEERERLEQEKPTRAFRGIRGVRGTRASMRGIRGPAPPRQEAGSSAPRGIPRRTQSGISRPATTVTRGANHPV